MFCSRHLWFHSRIVTWNGMESISFVSLCYFSSAVINVPTLCQTKKKTKHPLRRRDCESVCPLAAPNPANRDEQTVVYSSISFFESSTQTRRSIFLFLTFVITAASCMFVFFLWLSPRYLKAPEKNNPNLVPRARSLHNTSLLNSLSPSGG